MKHERSTSEIGSECTVPAQPQETVWTPHKWLSWSRQSKMQSGLWRIGRHRAGGPGERCCDIISNPFQTSNFNGFWNTWSPTTKFIGLFYKAHRLNLMCIIFTCMRLRKSSKLMSPVPPRSYLLNRSLRTLVVTEMCLFNRNRMFNPRLDEIYVSYIHVLTKRSLINYRIVR